MYASICILVRCFMVVYVGKIACILKITSFSSQNSLLLVGSSIYFNPCLKYSPWPVIRCRLSLQKNKRTLFIGFYFNTPYKNKLC